MELKNIITTKRVSKRPKLTSSKNAKSVSDTEAFKWNICIVKVKFPDKSLCFDIPDKQGTICKSKTFVIKDFGGIKYTASTIYTEVCLQIESSPFFQTPTKNFGWL